MLFVFDQLTFKDGSAQNEAHVPEVKAELFLNLLEGIQLFLFFLTLRLTSIPFVDLVQMYLYGKVELSYCVMIYCKSQASCQ